MTILEALIQLRDDLKTWVTNNLRTKVDKESGKGLSTNDYTSVEKEKLAGIADGANKTVVDEALDDTSENPVQNKTVASAISNISGQIENVASQKSQVQIITWEEND